MRTFLTLILICGLGCSMESNADVKSAKSEAMLDSSASMGWEPSIMPPEMPSDNERMDGQSVGGGSGKALGTSQEIPSATRKIIYTATMEIVVEVFDDVEKKISEMVKKHNGFVSSANLGRMQGERRSGEWTVRIPVDQYDLFLNAAGNIGVPASRNQTASDVTEEFVDLDARIANKKKLEARIVELLDRPDDKIQHVIEVERELARVREHIERMEGRLRYLKDQTAMTTVTLRVREERDYVPPQAPTLSNRVDNAWTTSLIRLRQFGENAIVTIVANAIGFGIFVLGLLIAIPILRRIIRIVKKRRRRSSPTETSHQG